MCEPQHLRLSVEQPWRETHGPTFIEAHAIGSGLARRRRVRIHRSRCHGFTCTSRIVPLLVQLAGFLPEVFRCPSMLGSKGVCNGCGVLEVVGGQLACSGGGCVTVLGNGDSCNDVLEIFDLLCQVLDAGLQGGCASLVAGGIVDAVGLPPR